MAFVRGVTACSISLSSICSVSMRGSTSTGFSPFSVTARIEAMYVFAGTITSSPGCMTPNSMYARSISVSESSPLPQPTQYPVPVYAAYSFSNSRFSSPCRYHPPVTTRLTASFISSACIAVTFASSRYFIMVPIRKCHNILRVRRNLLSGISGFR